MPNLALSNLALAAILYVVCLMGWPHRWAARLPEERRDLVRRAGVVAGCAWVLVSLGGAVVAPWGAVEWVAAAILVGGVTAALTDRDALAVKPGVA